MLDEKHAIRIFHYKGDQIEHAVQTNLVRPPITIHGPLIVQIRNAVEAIVNALADGVRVGALGFEVAQKYPVRVIREAVTNAVIHRDCFVRHDIHVRIFDHKVEIDSPGLFPGKVTGKNIGTVGSQPRNQQLVDHLREFPNPPNLDAGEGVPMMAQTMRKAVLYPPMYLAGAPGRRSVMVVLRNEAMPSVWEQVVEYLERKRSIGNVEVRQLLKTDDTLKASKQLRQWVESGLLEAEDPTSGKKVRRYRRPGRGVADFFSTLTEKKTETVQ